MILLYIIAISSIIGLVTGIIKGSFTICLGGYHLLDSILCVFHGYNHIETPQQLMDKKLLRCYPKVRELLRSPLNLLSCGRSSRQWWPNLFQMMNLLQTLLNTSEHPNPDGNDIFNNSWRCELQATFVLGDLDECLERATYAHNKVKAPRTLNT